MSKWREAQKQVLAAARKMAETGLVVGTAGNVSMRLPKEGDKELLAITPSSLYYDTLKPEDIQIIDFNGQTAEGNLTPSIETGLHIGIYKARPNVGAVIHTHSIYASAVALTGMGIPAIMEDQIAFLGGEVKLAEPAIAGSEELVENTIAALGDRSAALLPHHGAVGTGRTLREAFTAAELTEKTAKIYLLARLAGEVKTLPPENLEAMMAAYNKSQPSQG